MQTRIPASRAQRAERPRSPGCRSSAGSARRRRRARRGARSPRRRPRRSAPRGRAAREGRRRPACGSRSSPAATRASLRTTPRRPYRLEKLRFRCTLREMGRDGKSELRGRPVELDGARVGRVRRDPDPHLLGQGAGDPLAQRLEPFVDRVARRSEDLQVDERPEAEVGTRGRGGADEAAVPDRRDSGLQAPQRSQSRDRLGVGEVDPRLALDVQPDPVRECEPVAEPAVRLVLEVRVRVDEPGEDHRLGVVLALAELVPRSDRGDHAVVDRDRAVPDRRPLDGDHPVRGQDVHRLPAA